MMEIQKEEWSQDRVPTLYIGEHPLQEDFTPNAEHFEEALVGLVDTLRVTRKVLKEMMRQKGIRISGQNEFNREMFSTAKKLGESPDDLQTVCKALVSELFEEMVADQPKKK